MTEQLDKAILEELRGIREEIRALVRVLRSPVPAQELPLFIDDAAKALGCSRRKIFALLKAGVLDRAPQLGRVIRITAESVERALKPLPPRHRSSSPHPGRAWSAADVKLPHSR